MFASLTLKQKILATVILAVALSCLLVGYFSQRSAQQLIEDRMFEQELPNLTQRIGKEIEKDLTSVANAARQLANDRFVLDWVERGMPKEQESILINQLKDMTSQYGLVTASFADRQSAAYYNQDGFLRILNHEQDNWFYDYTKSRQDLMLSIFRESNGEVKLFVNFQQLDGRGLAGLAKSLDSMVSMLANFRIGDSGFVFMTDGSGKVKLHPDAARIDRDNLTQLASGSSTNLLNKQPFAATHAEVDGQPVILASSYIPLLDWYLVAQVPEAEIYAELDRARLHMVLVSLAIAVGMGLLGVLLAGSVSRPLNELARLFRELGSGDGDLTHRLKVDGRDELAQVATGFNNFVAKIHGSIEQVASNSRQLAATANEVAAKAQLTQHNCTAQRDRTVQVATAIHEMGATVSEIAGNASLAADVAKQANDQADAGAVVVAQAGQVLYQAIYVRDHVFHRHSQVPASYGQAVWSLYGQLNRNHWLPGSERDIFFSASDVGISGRNLSLIAEEKDGAWQAAVTLHPAVVPGPLRVPGVAMITDYMTGFLRRAEAARERPAAAA